MLVVEDDPQSRRVLSQYLDLAGFAALAVGDLTSAEELLEQRQVSLVLLDLALPDGDGLELLARLRSERRSVPVIVISARGAEPDRVEGLVAGADDYIAKPASPREVAARVHAVLRRSEPRGRGEVPPIDVIEIGPFRIDLEARVAAKGGVPLDLAPKEFDLLVVMATNPGRAFSRGELLTEVWRSQPDWQDPGTVTVHIRRLRRKLEDDPAEPRHLLTVYGHGYRFAP